MSKRKPTLRIDSSVINRGTDGHHLTGLPNPLHEYDLKEIYGAKDVTDTQNLPPNTDTPNLDTVVANFLKELDDEGDSEPLCKEEKPATKVLFGDWQECIDEKTQHPYYWNVTTDEVTWILPQVVSQHSKQQSSPLESEAKEARHVIADHAVSTVSEKSGSKSIRDDCSPKSEVILDSGLQGGQVSLPPVDKERETSKPKTALSEQCNIGLDKKISDSESSSETKVTESSTIIFDKLGFLGILKTAFTNFHVLLIETETRITDWKKGFLPTDYLLEKLQAANQQLEAYEESATPVGWLCHWDRTAKRYFYKNKATHEMQWHYPEIDSAAIMKTENTVMKGVEKEARTEQDDASAVDDGIPAKKSRREFSNEQESALRNFQESSSRDKETACFNQNGDKDAPPPLPCSPQEKPPLPPQPPTDTGIMQEKDNFITETDDGIMMEISDDEASTDDKKTRAMAASSVVSQGHILRKAPMASYSMSKPPIFQIYDPPISAYTQMMSSQNVPVPNASKLYPATKPKKSEKSKKKFTTKKPLKALPPLVVQWQRAKEQIELEERAFEEEEEEEINPKELADQYIKDWRQEQVSSGKARTNANFEPVPEDWRGRLLKKKMKK